MTKKALSQKEKIARACARAGTLKDKIEAVRKSTNEVRDLARGLKSELKETINLLNAIRRQMEKTLMDTDLKKHGQTQTNTQRSREPASETSFSRCKSVFQSA
jgi:hypothetical protein